MRTKWQLRGMKQSVFHRNLGGDGLMEGAVPLLVG